MFVLNVEHVVLGFTLDSNMAHSLLRLGTMAHSSFKISLVPLVEKFLEIFRCFLIS